MKRVILHHSLTKDGMVVDFEAIKRYHVGKGWGDIGYNFVIENVNGEARTFLGRPLNIPGAHTRGQNIGTIGVCIVGNYDITNLPTDLEEELYKLLDRLEVENKGIEIMGHCDYPDPDSGYVKTCPGKLFPLDKIKAKYNKNIPSEWAKESMDKAIKLGLTDGSNPKEIERVIVILDRLGLLD